MLPGNDKTRSVEKKKGYDMGTGIKAWEDQIRVEIAQMVVLCPLRQVID